MNRIKRFVSALGEDVRSFDRANTDERRVLRANFFSSYRGVPVFRIGGKRSGSFGAIFLTRRAGSEPHSEDIVRHEYGHTVQLKRLGPVRYVLYIGLPSWRQWGGGAYYRRPWEITADLFGGVRARKHTVHDIDAGVRYLRRAGGRTSGRWDG